LVIAAPIVFGRLHVLPIVTGFLGAYPEINVRLMLSDRNADIIAEHIDAAVRIGPLADSSLIATRVASVRHVVCGSPNFFDAQGTPAVPADLAKLPAVDFEATGAVSTWNFVVPASQRLQPVSVTVRLSVNTAEAAVDAATAGVGVTRVLSYQVERALRDGKLKIVLAAFEPEPLPVHIVHAAQAAMPLKLRKFIDFAAERLRNSRLQHAE
jgi:DNA-binding transcriptional LysR family regulator